jgi:hypothetical protein
MEWMKCFSENYANAVTAFSALGALILATITLLYLKREYSAKYRPYVTPVVHIETTPGKLGCIVSIHPINIGGHPCRAKLTNIQLTIGDENYPTPDNQEWLLLAPSGVGIFMPAGHVNEIGVSNIREGRYKKNRVEVSFKLETTSMENMFSETKKYYYEIDVLGENPQALFRPEWAEDA